MGGFTGPTGPTGTSSQSAPTGSPGPTGPTGSGAGLTGVTGPRGVSGPLGSQGPPDSAFYQPGPTGTSVITSPPVFVATGLPTSPALLGSTMVFYQTQFPLTSFTQAGGSVSSLRSSLPYTNLGPTTYAQISDYTGLLTPGGSQAILGVCTSGTNYVEFRFVNDSGQEVVMDQTNVASQIQLTYSIQYYI